MTGSSESSGKSKDRKERTEATDIDDLVPQASRTGVNELEMIPTKVPHEGDGYLPPGSASIGTVVKQIGDPGGTLTEDDLRRINTRKGLLQLLEKRGVDIQDVRKRLLYEYELRQLQVELVKFQR
jgi:hypothetical protein